MGRRSQLTVWHFNPPGSPVCSDVSASQGRRLRLALERHSAKTCKKQRKQVHLTNPDPRASTHVDDRDSIQRTQCWWLPYLVIEYEVNQVLITPLGGELAKPLYMYQAHL